jgi:glycosyltransferase involved in cell wall biosynthesis
VLVIGRITPRKQIRVVVEAFARLNASAARLVIAGNDLGGLQPALARARELGVDTRVEVTGLLRAGQRLQAMANADLVVCPSSDDVFGLVACEALLVGTPVIVGSDSGCAEIVGNCGVAVKPGDAAALAIAMASVLAGRVDTRRGRLPGRERILHQYNVRVVTEALDAIYREALSEGAERGTAVVRAIQAADNVA